MGDERETLARGPRPRATDEEPTGVVHHRHSIQESGHEPADPAAYESGDELSRIPRRQPSAVDEEA
jgi:hypothetical protein